MHRQSFVAAHPAVRPRRPRLVKELRNAGELMYTGQTIEELLELVLDLVEQAGGGGLIAPTEGADGKEGPWNQEASDSESTSVTALNGKNERDCRYGRLG
jgi:hypothetical protein